MKLKLSKRLQIILCIVLSCTTLTGCIFTDSVRSMGKAMGEYYHEEDEDDKDDKKASKEKEAKESSEDEKDSSEAEKESASWFTW